MVKTYPVPCTKEEIEKIIELSSDNDFYYTLFMLMKTTGRRISEYKKVQIKDIDFEKNIMMTWVLKRRKPAQKEAILSEEISRLLKKFISQRQLKLDDYLFGEVSVRGIQYALRRYAKLAGINHVVSPHNFRHYFITELVRQGWSYDKIAKLTGHAGTGSLIHYDHIVASDIMDDALKALKNI
jgi:integrase/recombinase XerD